VTPVAAIGIAAYGWLTVFQLMLAAGLPLGRMAWGGAHRVLPPRLRWASLFSALFTAFGAALIAHATSVITVLPDGAVTPLLWTYAGLFGLSVLANLFGATGIERLHGVPIALCCAAIPLILALG
jgi:hypothetical protein